MASPTISDRLNAWHLELSMLQERLAWINSKIDGLDNGAELCLLSVSDDLQRLVDTFPDESLRVLRNLERGEAAE